MPSYNSNYTGQQIDDAIESVGKLLSGENPAPKAKFAVVWEVATTGGLEQMILDSPSSSIGISIKAADGNTGIIIPTQSGDVYIPNYAYGTLTVDKSCSATLHLTSYTGDVFHMWYNGNNGDWVKGSIQASVVRLESKEVLTGKTVYVPGLYCVNVRKGSGVVTHMFSIKDLNTTVFSSSDSTATTVSYDGTTHTIEVPSSTSVESIICVVQYNF